MFRVLIFIIALSLSSCANKAGSRAGLFTATAPVHAFLLNDLFYGEAVGYLNRTGVITINSVYNPDKKCVGKFIYTDFRSGEGSLTCNSGETAVIQFKALSSLSGYGYGKSDAGPVSFTYGLTAKDAAKYLELPKGKTITQKKDEKPKLIEKKSEQIDL